MPAAHFYPSFALPDNLTPPYDSVHIDPSSTQALQAAPLLDPTLSRQQLVLEMMRITPYGAPERGCRDGDRLRWTVDAGLRADGLDEQPNRARRKRVQAEIGTLAMKKTIEFEVNYYQATVPDIARQLILHCVPTITIGPALGDLV